MALTQEHKDYIDAVISYLLDFPASPDTLQIAVNQLNAALMDELTEENDYSPLAIILSNPQSTLARLENCSGTQISLGEVKEGILEVITSYLENAAKKANLKMEELKWDPLAILPFYKTQNDGNIFTTQKTTSTSTTNNASHFRFPWQYIYQEGLIYDHAELFFAFEQKCVGMIVFLGLPWLYETDYRIERIAPLPDSDVFQDTYLMSLIPTAKKVAKEILEHLIYLKLRKEELASPQVIIKAKLDPNVKHLISHHYYLNALLNKELKLEQFLKLTYEQVECLTNPVVKKLLKEKSCSFEQVKCFKPGQVKVIGCYWCRPDKKAALNELLNITENEAQILMLPIINNLIHLGQLPFSLAKDLPLAIKPFLISALYMDYISHSPGFDFSDLFFINKHHVNILLEPPIADAVKSHHIPLSTLTSAYPYWLEQSNTMKLSPEEKLLLSCHIYAERLYAFYCNNEENLPSLLLELSIAANQIHAASYASSHDYYLEIGGLLISKIKKNLIETEEISKKFPEINILKQLNQIIDHGEALDLSPFIILQHLQQRAVHIVALFPSMQNDTGLFKRNFVISNQLEQCCRRLTFLTDFLQTAKEASNKLICQN